MERVCRWCSKSSNNFYSTKSLGVSGKPRGINMTTWQAACFVSHSIYHSSLFKLNLASYSRQLFTACLLLMSCKSPLMSLKSLTITVPQRPPLLCTLHTDRDICITQYIYTHSLLSWVADYCVVFGLPKGEYLATVKTCSTKACVKSTHENQRWQQ